MTDKPHGLKGRPSNARKGPEPRSARFQVRLTPAHLGQLDALRRDAESRNDAIARLIETACQP